MNNIDTDYGLWLQEQIRNLQLHNWDNLDIPNLIGELEGLNASDKRELYSYLVVILAHLLKWEFQVERRTGGWRASIRNGRYRLKRLLKEQPSLKPHAHEILSEAYVEAKQWAEDEMGKQIELINCPYTVEEVLNFDFLP